MESSACSIAVPRTARADDYDRAPNIVAALEAIEDVELRLKVASAIATANYKRSPVMLYLRAARTYAIRLLSEYGWLQEEINELLDTANHHIVTIALNADRDLPLGSRPAGLPVPTEESEEWAKGVACGAFDAFVTREHHGAAARAIRQDLIRAMREAAVVSPSPRRKQQWSAAHLARIAGITPAAVSQISNGTVNPRGNTSAEQRHRRALTGRAK